MYRKAPINRIKRAAKKSWSSERSRLSLNGPTIVDLLGWSWFNQTSTNGRSTRSRSSSLPHGKIWAMDYTNFIYGTNWRSSSMKTWFERITERVNWTKSRLSRSSLPILIVVITSFQFGKLSGYGERGHIGVMGVTCSASDYFQCNWPGTSEINIITGKIEKIFSDILYKYIFTQFWVVYA